jgi:hypothetical protein
MFSMSKTPRQAEDEPPQRRNRAQAIGGDVPAIGRQAFVRAGFADSALILHWTEIVGSEVARMARPLKLTEGASGGVLTLKAPPAAAVFLQHDSRDLCARINSYLGRQAVHRLRFVPGNLLSADTPAPRPRQDAAGAPADDPARRFAGPEELKGALLALAWRRQQASGTRRD